MSMYCGCFLDTACTPEAFKQYKQQRVAPWQIVVSQWHVWLVLVVTMMLVALVPYIVYRMLTAFENPTLHTVFHVAAICFGVLSEILLLSGTSCLSGLPPVPDLYDILHCGSLSFHGKCDEGAPFDVHFLTAALIKAHNGSL
ncbi:hypothetical protein QTP70_026608, partial [Hemibagrus guttatus]